MRRSLLGRARVRGAARRLSAALRRAALRRAALQRAAHGFALAAIDLAVLVLVRARTELLHPLARRAVSRLLYAIPPLSRSGGGALARLVSGSLALGATLALQVLDPLAQSLDLATELRDVVGGARCALGRSLGPGART
jgi:hypothetical protein